MAEGDKKTGVAWKTFTVTGASKEAQAIYQTYVEAVAKIKVLEGDLKSRLQADWNKKYPDGIDGKVPAFKINNGSLQYVMTDKPKGSKAVEDADDIFSHPQ